jgi:hypothetical protein
MPDIRDIDAAGRIDLVRMVAQWRKMAQAAGLMLAVGADMRIDDAARIITGVPGGAIEQQNYAPSTITSVRSFRPACAKDQRRLAQEFVR